MSSIEIIFPKVRAEILRLLFSDPSTELHLREISRRSHLTLGTIQQEVGRLTKTDLLSSRRDGNRLYYRANTQHPIFSELQGIALKTTGLREQIAGALDKVSGIEMAFVFGSSATGITGAASDVDLFVVGTVGLRALAPRLRPVASSLGREINPHVVSHETLSLKKRNKDAFIINVLAAPKIWITGDSNELERLG
jgi:predicted nucleotidyltransferase